MICVSIAEPTAEACLGALRGVDFGEIRLDKMKVGVAGIRTIFSRHPRLIATFRPGRVSEKRRERLLLAAIEAGAAFVDIELETKDRFRETILNKARSRGSRIIISYHNYKLTPSKEVLEEIVRRCFSSGADIAKIACRVCSGRDCARLLGLLDSGRPLAVIGLGEKGRICRIVAPFLGSPFTYASLGKGRETAAGQIDAPALRRISSELRKYVRR